MSRFLQVLLTIAGLGITAILGYASMRSDNQQAQSALLGLFTETLTAARDKCDAAMFDIAEDALKRVKTLESSRLFASRGEETELEGSFIVYEDALAAIKGTVESGNCDATPVDAGDTQQLASNNDDGPTPPSGEPEAANRTEQSQVLEALSRNAQTRSLKDAASAETAPSTAAPPPADAPQREGSDGPIAVLASYKFDSGTTYDSELGVSRHFEELQKQIPRDDSFRLKLLKATVSRHFAIVLEPTSKSRDEARRLVTEARRNDWAPDAFVQDRRYAQNWAECTNPTSIRSEKDC